MAIETHEFWTTLAQTAATLAGFTLAGFSIYLASTEKARSDGICHRYGFHDYSLSASWYYVFLIQMLFCVPLLLSLIYLWGSYVLNPVFGALYTIVSILLFIGFLAVYVHLGRVQHSYFDTLSQTYVNDARFNERRLASVRSARERPRLAPEVRRKVEMIVFTVVMGTTLIILIVNTYNILVAAGRANHVASLPNGFTFVSPGTLALISVGLGLFWIFVYILLYGPERLLFVIGDPAKRDLLRFRLKLNDAAKQIKDLQELLLPAICSPDEQLRRAIEREEQSVRPGVDKRLADLRRRIEGWSWDPASGVDERRTDKLAYHISTIDFCLGQKYQRYGTVTQLLREVELFDLGLTNQLRDLNQTWEQLRAMSRYYEIWPLTENKRVPGQGDPDLPPSAPSQTNF